MNFRLHPVEEYARTWTVVVADVALPDASHFAAPLRALMNSQITPSSVQLRVSKHESALDIRIAAVPECLDEYAARIQSIFGQLAVIESGEAVWQARQQLFDMNDAVVLKVSLPASEICAVSSVLLQWAADGELDIATAAQATGLMTVLSIPAPMRRLHLLSVYAQGWSISVAASSLCRFRIVCAEESTCGIATPTHCR